MTPGVRRAVTVVLGVTLLLLFGRGTVGFLSLGWWADAVSPDAGVTVRRWQWLGLALDAGAIAVASAWFITHAVLVARSIATVQVQQQLGGVAVRQLVPGRILLLGAVAVGLALGIVTGHGAEGWRDAIGLAWHGVTYGVVDPIMGVDIGVYVAQLPVWELAHGFALLLVGLALLFLLLTYLMIGAFRRSGRRVDVHPYARRHVGATLSIAAVVVAWGYLIAPYSLAILEATWIDPTALETRIAASHVMVGVALAVALLTVRWAFSGRHTLLLASWGVLVGTVVIEQTILPVFVAGVVRPAADESYPRTLATLLYGVRIQRLQVGGGDAMPVIRDRWDGETLRNQARDSLREPVSVSPMEGHVAGWEVVSRIGNDPVHLEVQQFLADTVSSQGEVVPLTTAMQLPDPKVSPGVASWSAGDEGVRAGSLLRRLALTWARQAPGILRLGSETRIDWHLDPVERLSTLLPSVQWRLVTLLPVNGELRWILSGYALTPGVPFAIPSEFGGKAVFGLSPALIGTISPQSGNVSVWLDPAADSLGRALGELHQPLVEVDRPAPSEVVGAVGYSPEWLDAQLPALELLTGGRLLSDEGHPLRASQTATTGGPAVQLLLRDPGAGGTVSAILGYRVGQIPRLKVSTVDPTLLTDLGTIGSTWRASTGFTQLYDSLRASGDTMLEGPLRWSVQDGHLTLWRSFGSAGRRGPPRLLWLGVASDRGVSGGRAGSMQWEGQSGGGSAPALTPQLVEVGRLNAARSWLLRADSALARGDLTAFGRAWESLKHLLRDSTPE